MVKNAVGNIKDLMNVFIDNKIPSKMEVALRYTLLTLFTLSILFKLLYTA